jgi:hypothetical protein
MKRFFDMHRRLVIAAVTLVAALAFTAVAIGDRGQGSALPQARAPAPAGTRPLQRSVGARPALERRISKPSVRQRVADASHAAALFASHSWYVAPPPPPPVAPPPPPAPTAPPFPYTFVGAYTTQGDGTVYFLAQGDRVVDAHVGDRLDGVYEFESATAAQLTFNYVPLNIRQLLPTGAPQ